MKILELFAGSRSMGKEAERRGHEVFSVDINPFEGIDLVQDIEHLGIEQIPFIPDVIWASPTCTSYTIAAISHHRNGIIPKSDFAKKSDRVVERMWQIIDYYKNLNPLTCYFVENPRGMFRKMPFVEERPRTTISYCQYGDIRMKPTDIFTNSLQFWKPKKMCRNYKFDKEGNVIDRHCHHQIARRGMPTGTQGLKGNYERSKIPPQLMIEVIEACERRYDI